MSPIRTARSVEHPRRNFEPAIRPRIAQCAAENRTIRFVDHLMDCNPHPEPWMPGINKHSENGPVGVLELRSTIHAAGPPRSDISPRSIMSGGIMQQQSIPTHTSLPPCSQPSRTSPSGGPKEGPSLTAAVRGSRTIVRVGTKEWLRQGPNQRMSRNRRATCPDPKRSALHDTGVSPIRRAARE
jgi:hypothetical protein